MLSLFIQQLRIKKNRNPALMHSAFWPHAHTHTGLEAHKKKALLNKLCVLDLPTADDTFPEPS